jgi:ATP-binding cassette subfamily C protein
MNHCGETPGALGLVPRPLFGWVMVFSVLVNLLLLTGPLYMLHVYDRVLGSRSEETLVALSVLVAVLFVVMGILDWARGRILTRAGAQMQHRLEARVFSATLHPPKSLDHGQTAKPIQDLDAIQRLFVSTALTAVFDLPWTPFFLLAIFVFHPWLGSLALAGSLALVAIAALSRWRVEEPALRAQAALGRAGHAAHHFACEREAISALGMRDAVCARWRRSRQNGLTYMLLAADRAGGFAVLTRTLRLFMQSAMIGLGAYLVLQDQLSPGAMIAGSILLARALAPLEVVTAHWDTIRRALRARADLQSALDQLPPKPARVSLPLRDASLSVESLCIVPPDTARPALRGVTFTVAPGQACGVIGPSGAGKSTLAHAIVGVWPREAGVIRVGEVPLEHHDPDTLGASIGYLPQRIAIFDGTIAENIARLSEHPEPDAIIRAARFADAHEMILR